MIKVQIQEFPSTRNIRKNIPRHVIIKLLKTSDEEKDVLVQRSKDKVKNDIKKMT